MKEPKISTSTEEDDVIEMESHGRRSADSD